MTIPSRQIGWSEKANLLWEISKKLDRLTKVWGNLPTTSSTTTAVPTTTTTTSSTSTTSTSTTSTTTSTTTTATPVTINDVVPYFSGGRMAVVSSNNVYTDTARTTVATAGDYVRSITELISNDHLQWVSSDSVRKTYLSTLYNSRYNLDFATFWNPAGDVPHIFLPNVFDLEWDGTSSLNWADPVTRVFVIRNRVAVPYEKLAKSEGLSVADDDYNHYKVSNSASEVSLGNNTGVAPFNKWAIVWIESNGSSSKVFIDQGSGPVQIGSNVTLGAGTLTKHILGSDSIHENQMDFVGSYLKHSIFSGADQTAICSLLRQIYPIGQTPSTAYPWAEISGAFNGTDTFVPTVTYHGAVSENVAAREYMWCGVSVLPATLKGTYLDGQWQLGRTTNLIRSDHRQFFIDMGNYASTNAEVFLYVKVYDTNGNSFSGMPMRSRLIRDDVAGTPSGTYAPQVVSITIENASPTQFDVVFTGNINNATGAAASFVIKRNGATVTPSSISFPNSTTVRVVTGQTFLYSDSIFFGYLPGTLAGSNGKLIEEFYSGIFVNVTNNIQGPQTIKGNLTRFTDTTSAPGWINLDYDWSTTGVKNANMLNTLGVSSGVGLSVSDGFPNTHTSTSTACNSGCTYGTWTSPSASITEIPDANISKRGPMAESGNPGAFQFTGLNAGQTYDLVLYQFVDDDNFPDGGTGTVTVTNGAGTSNASIDLTADRRIKTTFSSLTANGSGVVTVTYAWTGGPGSSQVGPFAFEFTKYP